MLVMTTTSGSISGITSGIVPSSISNSSTSLSSRPKMSAKLTATEVTPCSILEPVRLCETRCPLASAIAAVMRAVVVLPLLPVMTIFFALLAPTTALSTLGSMRRAIIPGRLVPPPIRKKRPEAPASFPAEMARASRARPRPEGMVALPLLSSLLCCPMLIPFVLSSIAINQNLSIKTLVYVAVQYSKPDLSGQVNRQHGQAGGTLPSNCLALFRAQIALNGCMLKLLADGLPVRHFRHANGIAELLEAPR